MDTIVCCIVKKRKIVGFYVVPRNNGYIHTVDEYGHDRHSHTIPKYPYIFIIQFNSWQEIKIQSPDMCEVSTSEEDALHHGW